MKITIDLNYEDVRKLIETKISNEASKHGYPGDVGKNVEVRANDGSNFELSKLQIAIRAELEVP